MTDTVIIDQNRAPEQINARLASTTNPRHSLMLQRLLQHAEGEAKGDLEAVMATLAPNPKYHTYGSRPEMSPKGLDAVRRFYVENIFGAGLHFFQFDIDRMVVDDDTIVTEGNFASVVWGRDARRNNLPVDDEESFYVVRVRMMLVWPFDKDCYILGEDSYSAVIHSTFLEKVNESQLPVGYRSYVDRRRAVA